MAISRDEVTYVADLARLDLSKDEGERFGEQLGRIIEYVEQLQEVDVEGVEPFISAAADGNVFREDVVRPSLSREDALANAPESGDDGFTVPRVVGGGDA